ncbi:TIGR00725 family protein [Telmatospirillum sp.]|uniref:TIGR00725 family protein n=1 Tax=Telmatospirillum sp. TaxID=2079197 RepID=UPI00283C1FD2|nr:TIGR00725 family protein [Telmatospirillum sp.]MDR3440674.1 TIGR00725 family protein [Telmatospirillum sp.]
MSSLMLDRANRTVLYGKRRFDARNYGWVDTDLAVQGEPVDARAALAWLAREGGLRAIPVAVIGPRTASDREVEVAEAVGRGVAELGLPLLTGGRTGVMEAASRGAVTAGGLTIGFIPDEDWRSANAYVTVPLATGIGPARNVLIARAAAALIAVGGEYGTLSEMAFGMQFGKPVFALCDAPFVREVIVCADVEDCLERLAKSLLQLP